MITSVDQWIQWLLKEVQLDGASIVLATVPLAIIQGFLGIFPFATLIMLHISVFGVVIGLITIWLIGTLSAILVFVVCRYFFYEWFNRKLKQKLHKYERWQHAMDQYGIWVIIFLRTLPIMPNNLISFMSAISPIQFSTYIWSSLIGNLSYIWLFGIISSSLIMPGKNTWILLISYIVFCILLVTIFVATHYKSFKAQRTKSHSVS